MVVDMGISDLSDDSCVGIMRSSAPVPPTREDLLCDQADVSMASSVSSNDMLVNAVLGPALTTTSSSSETTELSTHIGWSRPGGFYEPPEEVELFDPSKGPKKSNFVPRHNPNFDEKGAMNEWVSGRLKRESAVLNPLVDYADSPLLQPEDINDIMLDHFYPLMDVYSSPEERTRAKIVERALALAKLYDPLLIQGCVPINWDRDDLGVEFSDFLDSIKPKFQRGGAEARAALAAESYNWDTFSFPDGEALRDECHGDMVELVRKRQIASLPDRINLHKIMEYLWDFPGFDLLREVVVEGVKVHPDPEYHKNMYENLRGQEVTLQNVICKHAMDSWKNNRCLLFRESQLSKHQLSLLNFNPSFWVFKWTDVFGRCCLDGSNREDKQMPEKI